MRHLLTIAAAAGLAFTAQAATAADPIVMKFSHVVAENTPKGIGAKHFEACAEAKLPGKVDIQVYPNSQLYNDKNVLPALLQNDVQFAAPSLSKMGKYSPALMVYDLPFLFENLAAVDAFQQGPHGQKLLESMESKGFTGLGYWHNGMKQMSANKPLKVPADAKGLKFRIQSSDVLEAQFAAVGGISVKKPFSEVFTLLQTKAIDGTENPWSNTYSKKFFEVQDYISETDHGVLDYMVITSTKFWKGLPEDLRAPLKTCMDEATKVANDKALEKAMADRKAIIESGRTKVIALTAEERAAWRAAMKPVWAKFEDEVGKELIEAAANTKAGG